MQNPGEELVGEYLKHILGCDFVEYNLYTPNIQGEIDVVGINIKAKEVYICEVATHLITGLQYVKNNQPDNIERFYKKFVKNIRYVEECFPNHKARFMLWSPIVKDQSSNAKHNQCRDIKTIQDQILTEFSVEIEPVINQKDSKCLSELRFYARNETKELKSPIMRLFQIEEHLLKHIGRLDR
ncbi:hypothetical protein [Photobacterium carnosum]|uniref:hypothetical protein n=1 Tax=Photobacterium carnosum TaxID=2023717 RepID=UPI001E46E966|nr:hypothetical protein [Photobacterium carnosum]MCD9499022.1 hypothetical protein [Photobacterium carnosum]